MAKGIMGRLTQAADVEGVWTVIALGSSFLAGLAAFFTGLGHAGYAWAIPAAAISFPGVLLGFSLARSLFGGPVLGLPASNAMSATWTNTPDGDPKAIVRFAFQNYGTRPIGSISAAAYLTGLQNPSSSKVGHTEFGITRHKIMPGAGFCVGSDINFDQAEVAQIRANEYVEMLLVVVKYKGKTIFELWQVFAAGEPLRMATDQEIDRVEPHLRTFISVCERSPERS